MSDAIHLTSVYFDLCDRVMNRKQMLGKPDQRDLNENLAATHGLTHMIQECRKLFRVSVQKLWKPLCL